MLSNVWIATALCLLVGSSQINALSLSSSSSSSSSSHLRSRTTSAGKRGLPFNTASYTQPFSGDAVTWAYNWYSATDSTFNYDLEYIPMLWSNQSTLTSVWANNLKSSITGGSKHALGFNEPDLCGSGSSCMTVDSAVTAWQTYMQPYASQVELGTPAITNSGAPGGLTWLSNFMGNCTDCTFDFVVIHWYNTVGSSWTVDQAFSNLKTFVNQAVAQANGKPVWITEFGLFGTYTTTQLTTFLQNSMTWLDAQPSVERYAYFWDAVGTNYLLANSTDKNAIGTLYEDYDSAATSYSVGTATSTSTASTTKKASTTSTSTSTSTKTSTKASTTSTSTSTATKTSTKASTSTSAAAATTSASTCKSKKRRRRDVQGQHLKRGGRREAAAHHKKRHLVGQHS